MNRTLLAPLLFALSTSAACATIQGQRSLETCADELVKKGWVQDDHRERKNAETLCSQSSPEQLALAGELFDQKYEENYAVAAKKTLRNSPARIACAKKEFDESTASPKVFEISAACRDANP